MEILKWITCAVGQNLFLLTITAPPKLFQKVGNDVIQCKQGYDSVDGNGNGNEKE